MAVDERRRRRRPKKRIRLRKRRARRRPGKRIPKKPPKPTTPTTTTPNVGPESPTPVQLNYPLDLPDSKARLFLNRFGTGYTPMMLAQLLARGGAQQWLEWQLNPQSVPESPKAAEIDDWFGYLMHSPAQIASDNKNSVRAYWEHNFGYSNWLLMRRIHSDRVVLEQMATFLNNILHISSQNDSTAPYRFDYEMTIRKHAFGRFEDLLMEASLHPAMRMYLDNRLSVKGKPNENQGRELLELHSVSRNAGYSEAEVLDSARILSGYTVDWGNTYNAVYDTKKHTTGPVSVLGFTDPNDNADGQAVTLRYLKYLANHPSTAATLAKRMAIYFVSDTPSTGLVNSLAQTYLDSGTSLKAMLLAIAQSPEFLGSEGAKVRTPAADFVASARVLGTEVKKPTGSGSYATSAQWAHGELPLNHWPRPDGAPLRNSAWASPGRVLHSTGIHQDQAGGYWPTKDVTYRNAASWLPVASLTFQELVDHLCRAWLGRAADARLMSIATQVTKIPATRVMTTANFPNWQLAFLGQALLTTPEHMTT
jgi:uncharacterized protein (DUF1800 family)